MPTTPGRIEPNDIVGMACTTLVLVREDAGALDGAVWLAPPHETRAIASRAQAFKSAVILRSRRDEESALRRGELLRGGGVRLRVRRGVDLEVYARWAGHLVLAAPAV